MTVLDVFIGHYQHVRSDPKKALDEQGNWRGRIYASTIALVLAYLQPWPDPLCPTGLRYRFWDTIRALTMLFIATWTLRLALEINGPYPSFDLTYPPRTT